MATYNTGSQVDGHTPQPSGTTNVNAINTTLSTQIIVKVNQDPVGALQRLTVNQARPLARIQEIGTDGIIEIVPQGATTFELTADRIVFDQLRLPEAFSRGFRFINSQRLPFDIMVIDLAGVSPPGAGVDLASTTGIVAMTYVNCWFTSYSTPYTADNYLVTETASIWCETAYISTPTSPQDTTLSTIRNIAVQTDKGPGIEKMVNWGGHRGAMDASGILNSIFA